MWHVCCVTAQSRGTPPSSVIVAIAMSIDVFVSGFLVFGMNDVSPVSHSRIVRTVWVWYILWIPLPSNPLLWPRFVRLDGQEEKFTRAQTAWE